jgi:hypothetical protein
LRSKQSKNGVKELKPLKSSFFMKIVSFGKRSTTNLGLEVLLILENFKKSEPKVINK